MSERWVINASPVILLAKAGVIELLPQLCAELVVPVGVVSEVASGQHSDAGRAWLAGPGRPFLRDTFLTHPRIAGESLGLGESQVLAWALHNPGFKAVLDDRQGRVWASRHNLPLLGSLGVIVRLKRGGLLTEAAPALERIRTAGAYVSEAAIHAALIEAGEADFSQP